MQLMSDSAPLSKAPFKKFGISVFEHQNELEGLIMSDIIERLEFEEFLRRSNEEAVEEATRIIIEKAKPDIIEKAKPDIIEKARADIIEKAKPDIIAAAYKEIFECLMIAKKGIIEKSEAAKRLGYSLSQIDMMLN